jgi:hypothetical protein
MDSTDVARTPVRTGSKPKSDRMGIPGVPIVPGDEVAVAGDEERVVELRRLPILSEDDAADPVD